MVIENIILLSDNFVFVLKLRSFFFLGYLFGLMVDIGRGVAVGMGVV